MHSKQRMRLRINPSLHDTDIADLRRRLDVYSAPSSYSAFDDQTNRSQVKWWDVIIPLVARLAASNGRIRILEYGAGRSTFADSLGVIRERVEYHVQDVTEVNVRYLNSVADRVYVGDLAEIQGRFHLIFSTFVFEHIANPEVVLEQVHRLLVPGGAHIIVCPRYDFPGYLCPSFRHLALQDQLRIHISLLCHRIIGLISRQPRFVVNLEPAVLSVDWYKDADAVHVVWRRNVIQWARVRGYQIADLHPIGRSWRDSFCMRHLILSVACTKPAAMAQQQEE